MDLFARVEEIVAAVLAAPEAEREELLNELCGGDEELHREVTSLLAVDTIASDRLEAGPATELLQHALEERIAEGKRIGDFDVRRVVGTGGMGTVYEAVQDEPRRTVALKTLRLGLVSEASRRRFQYESEVLARLKHRGIAQIYQSGTVADGTPFIAMEFVDEARPIHDFVAAEKLDLRAIIELFREVVAAVHHGHQKGVIHRDIKPGNILVDRDGQPKVIDFGIARATENDAHTLLTRAGDVVGTLAYMSPEQLGGDGEDVDVRSDVYSLGVVLYELVTGQSPFDLAGRSITEVATILRDSDAPRPSRVPGRFAGSANLEELDWIVLTAMEREPDRRYDSAAALSADLERFLADEPLAARPPTLFYRLRKYARRHRIGLGAAAVSLVFLLGGTVATTLGWIHAAHAEENASTEARALLSVNKFLTELFGQAHPRRAGPDVKVVTVLERADKNLDHLAKVERPSVLVALHNALGATYEGIGNSDKALAHFEAAVQLAERHLPEHHRSRLMAYNNLGALLSQRGKLDRAELVLRLAHSGFLAVAGDSDQRTASALHSLAILKHRRGEFDAAERLAKRALANLIADPNHVLANVVRFQCTLARIQSENGEHGAAVPLLEKAASTATEAFGEDNEITLSAVGALAVEYIEVGKPEQAFEMQQRVLAVREQMLGETHKATMLTRANMAAALARAGHWALAEKHARRDVEIRKNHGHANTPAGINSRSNLAVILLRQGKAESAENLFRKLLPDAEAVIPAGHYRLAVIHKGIGESLTAQGRFAEAEPWLLRALGEFEKARGNQTQRIRKTLQSLVDLYEGWGKKEEAAKYRERLGR